MPCLLPSSFRAGRPTSSPSAASCWACRPTRSCYARQASQIPTNAPTPSQERPAMSGENCLAGLKILDLTQFEAGPSCTEALAWMGADVVKIENPKFGDPGRTTGRTDAVDALYFLQYNANKRSVAVNLKDPRGLELVKALARTADVMIENFAPGAIERLGLGYDVIKAINPAIIFCQVKGFGTGSPFEKNLAFDMIAQASGGLMSITGEEDGKPCKAGATVRPLDFERETNRE